MFRRISRWRRRSPNSRPLPAPGIESLEPRLAPAAVRVGVIGDYGYAGAPEADVAALVRGWDPDAVLTVGDNNYDAGSAATIDVNVGQYYREFLGASVGENRFFPSLGNHDWVTRTGSPALPTPYLDYFHLPGNERYYTFTLGPVQFFALDSGDGSGTGSDGFEPDGYASTSAQAQWLRGQLAASTAPWKLVYFHHAPYSSGAHGGTAVMQWLFAAWGATAVLSGHDHDYERLSVGGLTYFVTGTGGRGLTGVRGRGAGKCGSVQWRLRRRPHRRLREPDPVPVRHPLRGGGRQLRNR